MLMSGGGLEGSRDAYVPKVRRIYPPNGSVPWSCSRHACTDPLCLQQPYFASLCPCVCVVPLLPSLPLLLLLVAAFASVSSALASIFVSVLVRRSRSCAVEVRGPCAA